jgi:2-haloacid dehalogenase
MTDDLFDLVERRKLLTGIGTVALGGMAAGLYGRTALADAQESETGVIAPSVCVFDVNETLLDIESIAPLFQRLFGDRKVVREWFNQLILYSDAITLSGPYATFFTLGQGVMKMLGAIHNVPITEAELTS